MWEAATQVIEATVQIEQPLTEGRRTVGSGFLVSTTSADGAPQTVLVTAHHVLARMPGAEAKVGYRAPTADGGWRYAPEALRIRDDRGEPLWRAHPSRDVAVIALRAPERFARAAIPIGYLAPGTGAAVVQPGEELMVLGYPRGLAANAAGFPILRAGRVASYPLTPATSPTFLLDFSVFPGNSGGPVFDAGANGQPLIAGVLTQEVELDNERLGIGVVTHARYIRETIDLLLPGAAAAPAAPVTIKAEPAIPGAQPASEGPAARSRLQRYVAVVQRHAARLGEAFARPWRLARDRILAWLAPPPAASQRAQA